MQRWPGSQSREVTQAVWQRWNAHTSGESQSELIAQPEASAFVVGCVESEQAATTISATKTRHSTLKNFAIVHESAAAVSGRQARVAAHPQKGVYGEITPLWAVYVTVTVDSHVGRRARTRHRSRR